MRNAIGVAAMLAALACSVAAGQEIPDKPAVPQADWLDVWPGFVVLPWSFKTPPLNDATAAAYRAAGINGIHVDKKISASEAEWIGKHKFRFYLDHAAGKGTLYLRERKELIGRRPATQWDAGNGFIRRPKCLHDPKVLADLETLVRENVTAAAKHDAVCYSLDDEISMGNFLHAVETCWCEHCRGPFRAFALGLYGGSLDKLNAQWGTSFKSEAEITPETAAGPVKQALTKPLNEWNFSRWANFRQFQDHTLSDTLVRLTKLANVIDPKRPVGFEGGQQPSAYGGYDWSRLARSVQWVEAYDYGNNNEIIRSLAPQVVRMKTFFSTQDKIRDSHRLWYHFAHGDRGVILWPATKGDVGWWDEKLELRKDVAHLAPIFREQTGERLRSLLVGAEFVDDGIAIYYSQPSIRATWVMDATVHGDTWPARGGTTDDASSTTLLGRYAWCALLSDLGLQYTFVDAVKLAAGELNPRRFSTLILPAALALSDAEAAAIRKFVKDGGTVIADYLPGVMDEHCRSRGKVGALDDVFYIQHDWAKGLYDGTHTTYIDGEKTGKPFRERLMPDDEMIMVGECPVVERGLKAPEKLADGVPAMVDVRQWGEQSPMASARGRAILLNISIAPHLVHRAEGKTGKAVDILKDRLAGMSWHSRSLSAITPGAMTEVLHWRKGEMDVVCVVKNPQAWQGDWDRLAARAMLDDQSVAIWLYLPDYAERPVINERTGKPVDCVLDKNGLHAVSRWTPSEAGIYSFRRKMPGAGRPAW